MQEDMDAMSRDLAQHHRRALPTNSMGGHDELPSNHLHRPGADHRPPAPMPLVPARRMSEEVPLVPRLIGRRGDLYVYSICGAVTSVPSSDHYALRMHVDLAAPAYAVDVTRVGSSHRYRVQTDVSRRSVTLRLSAGLLPRVQLTLYSPVRLDSAGKHILSVFDPAGLDVLPHAPPPCAGASSSPAGSTAAPGSNSNGQGSYDPYSTADIAQQLRNSLIGLLVPPALVLLVALAVILLTRCVRRRRQREPVEFAPIPSAPAHSKFSVPPPPAPATSMGNVAPQLYGYAPVSDSTYSYQPSLYEKL